MLPKYAPQKNSPGPRGPAGSRTCRWEPVPRPPGPRACEDAFMHVRSGPHANRLAGVGGDLYMHVGAGPDADRPERTGGDL